MNYGQFLCDNVELQYVLAVKKWIPVMDRAESIGAVVVVVAYWSFHQSVCETFVIVGKKSKTIFDF